MRKIKELVSFSWPVFRLYRFMQMIFVKKGSIRILNYHNILPEQMDRFYKQISMLKKYYTFITPLEFCEYVENKKKLTGACLLLTFDDGFISNRYACEKVLGPLKIKAIFFLLSGLMDASLEKKQQLIYDGIFRGNRSLFQSDLNAMNKDDVLSLIENGHSIGSHTATHQCLSGIADENKLKEEVVISANCLENIFNFPIKYFAYPFGSISDINNNTITLALQRYDAVFSGIRGANRLKRNKKLFFREEISPEYSNQYLRFIIEGGLDVFYFFDRLKFKKMALLS